jgi:hypothetical protein
MPKFPLPSYERIGSSQYWKHIGDYTAPGVFVRVNDTRRYLRTEGVPLAPRRLPAASPWCRTCWREQDDCHCAPALNADGSLRVNASPSPKAPRPEARDALKCKGCGRVTGCTCGTPAAQDTLALVVEMQRQRGQRA